jgi:hypothetical protein
LETGTFSCTALKELKLMTANVYCHYLIQPKNEKQSTQNRTARAKVLFVSFFCGDVHTHKKSNLNAFQSTIKAASSPEHVWTTHKQVDLIPTERGSNEWRKPLPDSSPNSAWQQRATSSSCQTIVVALIAWKSSAFSSFIPSSCK